MSFLFPQFLWIGLGASALVAALHFIVTRQPLSEPFPTARFVPDAAVEAVSRATQPSDLLVLLLRLLAIMSVAAALGRPVISPDRVRNVRLILADLSRTSENIAAVRDSVRSYARPNDLIIGFDSTARQIPHPDSILNAASQVSTGNLSAALVSAIRSAGDLRERSDSISLVVVSAFPAESWDAATDTLRNLWPGAVTVVHVARRRVADTSSVSPVPLHTATDDPFKFSLALASKFRHAQSVTVIRSDDAPGTPNADQVVLHWPIRARPIFARRSADVKHGALIVGKTVLVAPFSTQWEFPDDSIRNAEVVARWEDGTPAAVQRVQTTGCTRSTNIPVTSKGDFAIRFEFVEIVSRLISSCAETHPFIPLSDAALLRLKGGSAAAPRDAFPNNPKHSSPFTPWLLAAALIFLLGEQFARRAPSRRRAADPIVTRAAA
jgi:hypothetical protein